MGKGSCELRAQLKLLEMNIRFGLSSFISRLSRKLSASQPICPTNMSKISTSRFDHIRVT